MSLHVTGNDVFDTDSVVLTIARGPPRGAATVNGLSAKYRPDNSGSGTDSFACQICSGDGTCDIATATLTLNSGNR